MTKTLYDLEGGGAVGPAGPQGSQGPQGLQGPAGADGSGGSADYFTLAKADLTQTSQTAYGTIDTYTAGANITNGTFVTRTLSTGGGNPVLTVAPASSMPTVDQVVGLALDTVTSSSNVRVLTRGIGTARFSSTVQSPTEVRLNGTTTGQSFVGTAYTFLDSGGASSDYSANESYTVVFDTGSASDTWTLTFTDFQFEHTTSTMYDRLGVQTSSDGTTWSNASVGWWQTSATSTAPWSTSFGGSSWNSGSSAPGWIIPNNTTRAILLGWGGTSETVALPSRYIKFTFVSDGSSQELGWNIALTSSSYSGGATNPVTVDTALELDGSDLTKLAENGGAGAIQLGKAVWDDASNDSLVVRLT